MLKIPARFKQCDLSVSLAFDYCDCIVNMGTRAAAFTVKIRSLYDYQLRLQQGVQPPPSGVDIANTIKYFSQTLLTVLKDVPNSPLDLLKKPEMDATRMGLFPSLDYKGLYNALIPFIEVAPLIQYGLQPFGQAMLQCLGCLLPFLEHDLIDNLPYLTASSIAVLPTSLHQDVVNSLCFYILPFTIGRYSEKEHDMNQSVSAVLMMVFQYSPNTAHHCQLLECLMTLKQSILKDILSVIAYGASTARSSAAKLLFYYWPTFNANLFDRKNLIGKLGGDSQPFVCQRDLCPNAGNAEAAKVCYDHCISITFASDRPPPLYLCIECANEIHREHPNQRFFDILHPMQQVSLVCENKNCRSTDKSAISICFSTECASYNGNHPIRYCEQCHNNRHNNKRGGDHIVHKAIPPTWTMEVEMQTYMVEAIVSLLKEAKIPTVEPKETTEQIGSSSSSGSVPKAPIPAVDNITIEERQLLGRYGVWLLVGRCTPDENTPVEILGRLLAMLFHWFHMTAYSYDGQKENSLEKLKNESVCDWLREIAKTHYKLFISCLLPHPPDYARVGGHWDTLVSRTSHLKDGLNRLFCLVPYEVITQEIWDYVMPHWMEAIVNDVPEKELTELRIILSKILDPEMSPLGFNAKKMYHFVALRFEKTTAKIQEQALHWLQTLTSLEIVIPLHLLFSIFGDGVTYMKSASESSNNEKHSRHHLNNNSDNNKNKKLTVSPVIEDGDSGTSLSEDDAKLSQQAEFESDAEHNLFCCILMLDILLKQMELQDIDKHTGLNSALCKDVCSLLKTMVTAAWIGKHACSGKLECGYCESSIMWHQLCLNLVKYLSPIYPAHPPDPPSEETIEDGHSRKSPPESDKKESKSDVVLNMPIPEVHSVGGVLVHMPHIMTATVETVSEQLDLAAIIPAEKVVSAVARAITLSESDVATATVQVAKPQVIGENDEPIDSESEDLQNFWHTSVGKFKFCIDDLPQPLQYIYQLLQELSKVDKPDILYYMLQCLNILILHGDACTKASKEHRGFFIWCQENLLIKNLWDICNANHSHICQEAVPLLLHCITLPAGSDVFWKIIKEDFHNNDWRIRFVAVERVTVIARFMDSSPLRNVLPLQAALANAFCYLISSMDDSNVYVAQRATLYLGTIHDKAIRSLIMCLETQFDSVIVDRPMVLQSLYQLHNSLSERKILTWEFFLNRFDTLFLEAQVNLEKSGDISYLRESKEKVYSRQYSAPILKRKSSRFGLDGHMHSLNVVDDQNLLGFLQRVIDLEEADKETMHLLIFLLMQFLSRSDQAYPADEKNMAKTQGIVLRHLYLLLGYSQNDRGLYLPPQRLRSSPAFSVYLANLPQLLDQNHLMGRMLLSTSLILLQYAPSPYYIQNSMELQTPTYSLWALEPHIRRNWLMSLVVLLYKYQYCQQPTCIQISSLIRIVLNTLDSQHHRCRRIPATIIMGGPPSRSRDVSQPSLGTENEPIEPPLSPMCSSDGQSVQVSLSSKGKTQVIYAKPSSTTSMETHWEESIHPEKKWDKNKKIAEISLDADDTESELIAIPESDMSDSTLHGSVQDSFEETMDESCCSFQTKGEKVCAVVKIQEPFETAVKTPKDVYLSQIIKTPTTKRPTWIIGSEDESLKSWENKNYSMHESSVFTQKNLIELQKYCPKITPIETSSLVNTVSVVTGIPNIQMPARTVTTDAHKPISHTSNDSQHTSKPVVVGKHKKILEPIVTGSCAPSVSECEDCARNNRSQNQGQSHGQIQGLNSNQSQNQTQLQSLNQKGVQSSNNHHLVHGGSFKEKDYGEKEKEMMLPAPSFERLLPIGAARSPILKNSPHVFSEDNLRSPDSPLSKMDVALIDSPKESIASPTLDSQLEIPSQERLLPIGQPQSQPPINKQDITQFVDKVSQALGLVIQPQQKELNGQRNDKKVNGARQETIGTPSPRRLIKQVALESPPNQGDLEESHMTLCRNLNTENKKDAIVNRHRVAKVGPFMMGAFNLRDPRKPGTWFTAQMSPHVDGSDLKQSSFRIGDESVNERCAECGMMKEEYSDEEIGLCIVTLGTFIHREPALASPMLPDILNIVAKVSTNAMYPWQSESNIHLPGGAVSVAHQFLRCVLHQLAPNGVFTQMFQTHATEKTRVQFFKSIIQALIDFNELNPVAPLQLLLETLNSKKTLPVDKLPIILENMACYLDCLPLEAALGPTSPLWCNVLQQLESYYRRIVFLLHTIEDISPLLRIMITVFKIPVISQFKGLLEPFSKVLSYAIQTDVLKYNLLVDVCYLCNRAFTKDRDKLILSRMVVYELVQALKFKTSIPDSNLLMLINLVLQDVGGSIPSNVVLKETKQFSMDYGPVYNTNVSECMRLHLGDILEFLTDFHTLAKIKSYCKGIMVGLNEDTLGGIIKCSVAQYLSLEITRGRGDNRALCRYLPWLYNAPAIQQTPREFIECISHIRLLSWMLLGSLTHTALHGTISGQNICQPIPQEASCQIADHIQIIMAGFAEQSKASVLHMSSLFHTFILCQLWTIYLEQGLNTHLPITEAYNVTMNILFDFWGKVTPCILQLIQQSKMLSEIVSLHFLSMLEALIECHSTFVGKLLPLWTPVLCSNHIQFPGHLQVRLQNCRNFSPVIHSEVLPEKTKYHLHNPVLLKWLQRLQFKMGQIEHQSSQATQFYSL